MGISRNSEAKPKLIRAFSTFFVCCYSSIIIKMTSTLYLMACLMTVVVSKPYLPWMYPSLYTTNPRMTSPLMTGMFISKAVGPNAKMMFDAYNKVWGYEGDGDGLTVKFGELSLDMKYYMETTSTEWTDGAEMKTYTWRTSPNSIRIRNMVEDKGIVETSDLHFLPNGVQISKVVTKGFQSAHNLEFYERVDEDGNAKTLQIGWI